VERRVRGGDRIVYRDMDHTRNGVQPVGQRAEIEHAAVERVAPARRIGVAQSEDLRAVRRLRSSPNVPPPSGSSRASTSAAPPVSQPQSSPRPLPPPVMTRIPGGHRPAGADIKAAHARPGARLDPCARNRAIIVGQTEIPQQLSGTDAVLFLSMMRSPLATIFGSCACSGPALRSARQSRRLPRVTESPARHRCPAPRHSSRIVSGGSS